MSIYAMARVWDHSTQKGAALLLLLAMADVADELGVLFAGSEWLGGRARIKDKRQVRRIAGRLEEAGEVVSIRSQRADGLYLPNHHIIVVGAGEILVTQAYERVAKMIEVKGGVIVTRTGDITRTGNIDNTGESPPKVRVISPPLSTGDITPRSYYPEEDKSSGLTASNLWAAALVELEAQMTKATFTNWFHGTTASRDGDTLVVHVRNTAAAEWLSNRMDNIISRTVAGLAGRPLPVRYEVKT